jgi:hypothetical protein
MGLRGTYFDPKKLLEITLEPTSIYFSSPSCFTKARELDLRNQSKTLPVVAKTMPGRQGDWDNSCKF